MHDRCRRWQSAVLRSALVNELDFDKLLDAMPDAVLVADMESRIVYANASVHALLGWAPEALIGQSLHAIQPERLHEAHDSGFGRYATTGVRSLFGTPIRLTARRFDGTECDVELNLAEITDASGGRMVLGVLRDLGERVELERHLAVLRYLRAITAAAAQLWTRLDPKLVLSTLTDVLVKDFDAALARTWMYEPESNLLRLTTSAGLSTRIKGSSRETMDVATHPSKVAAVARTRTPLIRNDLTDPAFDQDWVSREGLKSVACLPLVAGNQLLGVMVGFFREPIRDEVSETIGHLAALGAAALNDARLVGQEREARSVAEAAVTLRDRFLAVASHELRTPLTVVRGNWELLGRRLRATSSDPEAQRKQVDTSLRRLGQGIEQLRRLVEDLLDVNRLRGGAVELHRSEVDLVALIHDTVAGVTNLTGRSRIRLDLPVGPVIGWWDAGRLTQVIHNLVANALKYSPPKSTVAVSLTELDGRVAIRITDSGIGIASDQLNVIFEPFSRAPNASDQHYPGLGLGLAVSREIVGQLEGAIWAESSGEGQGSSFVVELQRGSPP